MNCISSNRAAVRAAFGQSFRPSRRSAWLAKAALPVVATVVLSAAGAAASGATDTWTGTSSANWNDAGNWTGGNAPPLASDLLVFDGSTNTTTNNDFAANTNFGGIGFAATASSFTLGGNAVLLSGDINDNSANAQSITLGLLLDGATSNVNVTAGGSLSLGALTMGLAAGSTNLSTLNINSSVSATSLTVRTS